MVEVHSTYTVGEGVHKEGHGYMDGRIPSEQEGPTFEKLRYNFLLKKLIWLLIIKC